MELFSAGPYTCEGEDFEIRIYYDDKVINVAAFRSGYPANGYRYQVKIPKKCETKKVLEEYPVPELA